MGNESTPNDLTVINTYILNNTKNSRRKRHKIVIESDCFELLFDTQENEFRVSKKEDLFFSIIPYDTSRKYIERAVFIFLNNSDEIDAYLKRHLNTILTYISLSLFQVTGKRVSKNSNEVLREFEKIENDIYFKVQVAGRLLQHDETGPLSATLPYKFLYDFNVKTGIHGYIDELTSFYKTQLNDLPFGLGRGSLFLLENTPILKQSESRLENQLMLSSTVTKKLRKSELSDEQLLEIKNIRKNYKAHSQHPKQIEKYFDNVHDNVTNNQINVVSDIHSTKATIELISPNFNIIAGDLSDAFATNDELKGIAVIGNHDIVECGLEIAGLLPPRLMKSLKGTTDTDYSSININDPKLYTACKNHLEKRFSGLVFLNNQSYTHKGVRYIGLSVPICYIKKRKKAQKYIYNELEKLLVEDFLIPTVIISHAPLFNELNLLSPKSKSYNKKFECVDDKLRRLFAKYHILGVIHGHHHIPASTGVIDYREFAGKKLFVICSVYSYLNKGLDLQVVLDNLKVNSPVFLE